MTKKLRNQKNQKNKMTERALVKWYLETYHSGDYYYIDQDSPARVFRSGWDFLLSTKEGTGFYEAKKTNWQNKKGIIDPPNQEKLLRLMTDYQKLTAIRCLTKSKLSFFLFEFREILNNRFEIHRHKLGFDKKFGIYIAKTNSMTTLIEEI